MHLSFHIIPSMLLKSIPNYIMEKPELEVPTYFTDWEMGYQTNGFRAVVVDNKVGTLEDFFA